jgi:putative addiction module component (TIGR02574 family)
MILRTRKTYEGDALMAPDAQIVLNEALMLPPVERAALIEELLASFDRKSRESIDAFWAQEAERRVDASEHGKLLSITVTESRERINRR